MIGLLILANGFFAAAEIAVIASRRGRLRQLADEGSRGALAALELAENPNRFLPTVQVGITLVSTLAAAFGGAHLAQILAERLQDAPWPWIVEHRSGVGLGVVVLAISFCSLVLGELVPKRLALRHAERLACLVARPMRALEALATPAVRVMGWATSAVMLLFGGDEPGSEQGVSLEDIQHLIKAGKDEGVLEAAEQTIALEALQLGERTVRDIMRPRIEMEALDVATPSAEVIGTVAMSGFSRLPVYEGDLDHIIGFVHFKDLFRQHYLGWPLELRKMLKPALFVPETLPLDRLLERFQQQGTQLAVVLDEFGGTEGVVTLEDVVSELVGEIRDTDRQDRRQAIVRRDDQSWLVDGRVNIDELFEETEIKPPPDADEPRSYSTVAGLVLDLLGRIPAVGEIATWDSLTLEVVDMDGQRIDRLLITQHAGQPGTAEEAN